MNTCRWHFSNTPRHQAQCIADGLDEPQQMCLPLSTKKKKWQEYIFLHDPYLRLRGTQEGGKEHPKKVMHCQYLVADGHGPYDTRTKWGAGSKVSQPWARKGPGLVRHCQSSSPQKVPRLWVGWERANAHKAMSTVWGTKHCCLNVSSC